MSAIIKLKTEGDGAPPPERSKAPADKLLSGDYRTITYNQWTGEDERLYCGTWECTPGKVKIDYTEWEFCHLLAGIAVLTNASGQSWRFEAGDGFIIPPGFQGTWATVETVRKHYVIIAARQ
jgi:uncharacterized cupin superfamily protein